MSVFVDILNLLSGPTGGMAHHLILLFCIWAIVGLALSRLSRGEQGRSQEHEPGRQTRILIAGALLSLCRFLPIIVALLDRQDGTSLVRLGPPLERFVDTLSILLICSAFVLPSSKKTLNRLLIGLLGLFSLGLYVIAAFQWSNILETLPSALYNRALQRWAWELWQLALLIPAFIYTLVGPVEEREALSASLGVLIAAHLAQTLYPVASQIPHAAAWVRLANLIAFPLLGVSTYLLIFQHFETEAIELQTVNKQSLTQITNLMALLEANTRLSRSLNLDNVLRSAVLVIAQELQSDLCAIALTPETPDTLDNAKPTQLELSVVFDTPDVFSEGTRFRLQDYPVIQHAVIHDRPAILGSKGPAGYDVSTSSEQATAVFELLQGDQRSPQQSAQQRQLIVQPIESSTDDADAAVQVIGAMLICRTDRGRSFTLDDAHKSESLAAYLGPAIGNARRHSQAQARIKQLAEKQHAVETDHVRTKTDLENRLQKSQEQAAAFMQRMYEAERGEQQAQKDAHQVHREMAQLRQESQQEIAQGRAEIKRGIQHATRLTQRIAELDAARIRLTNLVETLQMDEKTRQLRLAMSASPPSDAPTDLRPQPGAADVLPDRATEAVPERTPDVPPPTQGFTARVAALLDDLGQPTATLLQDTERLATGSVGALDNRQRTLLSHVRANVERLSFMLGNLAAWHAIDTNRLTPRLTPTHISRLIRRSLDNVRFRLAERKLRTRLALGAVPIVQVDPDIVQKILDNLLDTLYHRAQEGTTVDIQTFIEQENALAATEPTTLHITLSDTAQQSAGGTNTVDNELVQALVQIHGGRVWCVSQPDTGTTFHLTIPVDQVNADSSSSPRTGDRRE